MPLGKLQYSTRAAVVSGVPDPRLVPIERLGADHLAPGHEFVGAELIRLDRVPCAIQNARTLFAGTHAIEPVVARHEIAARVTHDGYAHRFDFGCDVLAVTLRVGQGRSGFVDAPVNGPAQMLDETTK